MRRWLGWLAIGWLLAICVVALLAYGRPAAHQTLDQRTRAVASQLRCPICQGESVADSPSDIARSMRALIRERLAEGQSPAQIEAYFVSRYSRWILLAPPRAGVGNVAWLAPPLLLLGGLALLLTLVAGWRQGGRRASPEGSSPYLERVRAELAETVDLQV
jgi:cytochrome c-type biogenesis protein CcmH